jgi:hypothetical protein
VAISSDLLLPLELVKTTVPGNRRVAVPDGPPLVSKRPDTVPGGVDWIWIAHPDASARRQTDETAKSFRYIPTPMSLLSMAHCGWKSSGHAIAVLRPRPLEQIGRCSARYASPKVHAHTEYRAALVTRPEQLDGYACARPPIPAQPSELYARRATEIMSSSFHSGGPRLS